MLGMLQETFSGRTLSKAEELRQTQSIPPGVLQVRGVLLPFTGLSPGLTYGKAAMAHSAPEQTRTG